MGTADTSSASSVTASSVLEFDSPKFVNVCINEFPASGRTTSKNAFTFSIINNVNSGSIIQYKSSDYPEDIDFGGTVDISRLNISLKDSDGTLLSNFTGTEWKMLLQFE